MSEPESLDLLEKNPGDDAIAQARAEERRQSAVSLVNAIYRLIKILGIHAESNQAVSQLVEATASAVNDYCQRAGSANASVLFADDTVFVNGQMLKASRDTYATALRLGAFFEKCGISEATFQRGLDAPQVTEFARAVHGALRDGNLASALADSPLRGVRLRRAQGRATAGEKLDEGSVTDRIVRTYASSIVVLRAFYAEVRQGKLALPHRIKRIAQKLVTHADEDARVLLALTAARTADSDEAAMAVNTAILAVLLARRLTSDRAMLGGLAMAALLLDVGKPRLAGSSALRGSIARQLNEDELDRLPASTAAVFTALGRIHAPSITRTVVAFEAQWIARAGRIGPVYRGRRTATVLTRILACARTFNELMTPVANAPALGIDDVVQIMSDAAADETERTYVKLLISALGFFPVGTTVELSTGELAIVTAVPVLPVDFARPLVRLMYDEAGNVLERPVDLDLAAPPTPGQPVRCVRRTVEYDAQQMKAMRSFIIATVSGKKPPANHPALQRAQPPAPAAPVSQRSAPAAPVSAPVAQPIAPAPSSPRPAAAPARQGEGLLGGGPTAEIDLVPLPPEPTLAPPGSAAPTRQAAVAPSAVAPSAVAPTRQAAVAPSAVAPATRQVGWDEYQQLAGEPATPPPVAKAAAPATLQVSWDDYQKVAGGSAPSSPPPSAIPSAPGTAKPAPAATRQVSWDDYQKVADGAAPSSPPPSVAPSARAAAKPAPAATRQVSWDDYQKVADGAAPSSPPPSVAPSARAAAKPAPAATRQVSWNDYQKVAGGSAPSSPPAAGPAPTPAAAAKPAPAATRQVSWNDYQKLTAEPVQAGSSAPALELGSASAAALPHLGDLPPLEHLPPEEPGLQDDTDLLLAGVDVEEPGGELPPASHPLDDLLSSYLDAELPPPPAKAPASTPRSARAASPARPNVPAASLPRPNAPAASPPRPTAPVASPPRRPAIAPPTRQVRWGATEALLSELEAEKASERPPMETARPPGKPKGR